MNVHVATKAINHNWNRNRNIHGVYGNRFGREIQERREAVLNKLRSLFNSSVKAERCPQHFPSPVTLPEAFIMQPIWAGQSINKTLFLNKLIIN